jgi:thiamine thiazole synthase
MPGGGMMFSEIVVQQEAAKLLEELGVGVHEQRPGYFTADSVETLGALLVRVARAGVKLFNLISVEDVLLVEERVSGLVLNWTAVEMAGLHVDPLTMKARAVMPPGTRPRSSTASSARPASSSTHRPASSKASGRCGPTAPRS